jgi:hypothetical protein
MAVNSPWNGEQFARPGDVDGAGAVGQQAVVTDAMEGAGQPVHEVPDDPAIFLSPSVTSVIPAKAPPAAFKGRISCECQ